MLAILVSKSCFVDGQRFPLPLRMSTKKVALEMESAPYVARPLIGFQHLASFSPYLLPHGLELIGNFAFD